jgi:hypothetical protein
MLTIEQQHRWIIIGILLSSLICCYVYFQCILPCLIKKLVKKNLNEIQIKFLCFFFSFDELQIINDIDYESKHESIMMIT